MRVFVKGYKGAGFGGWFIKRFTYGEYSHVSLLFYFEDTPLNIEIESIQGKGVHILTAPKEDKPYDLYEVECTPQQASMIYASAKSFEGSKYDWAGIYGFLRRRKKENPNKWFCSELVAHCLLEAGIELMRLPAWKQSPVMVCSSVAIKPVSKGE